MPAGSFNEQAHVSADGASIDLLMKIGARAWLRRSVALATALFVVFALATTSGAAGSSQGSEACAGGDAEAAAADLFGAGTELVGTERIAGLQTALVLEPRIYPGTRRRMIAAGDGWCEATSGFNRAWRLNGRSVGDGGSIAMAYARLAAAPYFDDVTVTDVAGAAGAWTVETHARTNGVVARWSITTDASGIRTAGWTATDFARRPFVASWEGLTALPGAAETYTRLANGLIDDERGLPTAASAAAAAEDDDGDPGLLQHTFADGYTIVTSIGDSHVGVDLGMDTGVSQVDKLRATMRAARENYEEFLSWGLTKGWRALPGYAQTFGDDVGFVYLNDALGAACLACVFISDHFQIHMNSEVQTALDLLGYDGYLDRDKAYSLIIGHEMFHNFQNRYNRPGHFNQGGRSTHTSYSEGTARFQETLHTYAETTFAPDTLVTANDANGCNGFDSGGSMDAGMAAGPWGGSKTYNACLLWGPWYVENGKDAFLGLVREGVPAHSPNTNVFLEMAAATEQVTGTPVALQLAEFAGATITGYGRAWPTFFGTESLDWGSLFERWTPSPLEHGQSTRTLSQGGIMAHEIVRRATVSVSGSDDARLFILRDERGRVTVTTIAGASTDVGAAKRGTRLYAVAVRAIDSPQDPSTQPVTITVTAKGKQPPSRPAPAPVTRTVTALAPGAGVRIGGVTSAFLQFEVPADREVARAEVVATNMLPGDIDLYLQRRNANNTWSDTGAAGESSSTSGESMSSGALAPGTYRIDVHNWAGPPGNQISLRVTFFNSAGEAGA